MNISKFLWKRVDRAEGKGREGSMEKTDIVEKKRKSKSAEQSRHYRAYCLD